MANNPDYRCTNCSRDCNRELLTVKKTVFLEMGIGGRTVRSRVIGWLCPDCTADDTDWKREKFVPPTPAKERQLQRINNG